MLALLSLLSQQRTRVAVSTASGLTASACQFKLRQRHIPKKVGNHIAYRARIAEQQPTSWESQVHSWQPLFRSCLRDRSRFAHEEGAWSSGGNRSRGVLVYIPYPQYRMLKVSLGYMTVRVKTADR